jgi:cell filamentation protein
MTESTDPYVYPGTNVLKNLRDTSDGDLLARFEAEATSRRIIELIGSPVPGRFDTAHLKAIHKHIFQDVYAWAGQFRTVYISKGR